MATLIVRQVDERIVDELKEQARRSGRSAEAQHRLILQQVLGQKKLTGRELVRAIRQRLPELTDQEVDVIGQGSRGVLDGRSALDPEKEP